MDTTAKTVQSNVVENEAVAAETDVAGSKLYIEVYQNYLDPNLDLTRTNLTLLFE